MSNSLKRWMPVGIILSLMMSLFSLAAGQTINVTFQLNTSTNPDTLQSTGFAQIRGALNGQTGAILPGGGTIDWGSGSTLILNNDGGDYWSITFQLNTGDTLAYKFWTGINSSTATTGGGWENDLNATNGLGTGNRGFIAGSTDTTVALQYFNGTGATQDQLWRPFADKVDSIAVFFRVNMAGVIETGRFDPAVNGPVGVRGDDTKTGGVINWGSTLVHLTRENTSLDSSFYSGVAYIPKDSAVVGDTVNYKFFIDNGSLDGWEGGIPDNRKFGYSANLVVGNTDTTLHWVYFNNEKPTGKTLVNSTITFQADVQALEGVGLFNRGLGDQVKVIGAKGWDRPSNFINMNFQPALQEWSASEPFSSFAGTVINYKYFIVWDSSRVDTNSANYIKALSLDDGWEEPGITGGGNRQYTYQNAAQQTIPGEFNQTPQFYNSLLPNSVITTPIAITFNIDMSPAMDRATNPVRTLFDPATDSVFIQFDGSMFALTQGLPAGGAANRFQLKDANSDGIYSGTLNAVTPTIYQLAFVVVYSTPTGDEQNGGGFDRGRRYYQYINPIEVKSDGTVTWPSAVDLPTLPWQDTNLSVEDPPDLTVPTAITGGDAPLLRQFKLNQNYPNPFNPTTTIAYQVAKASQVKILIYNLLGQRVKTLVDNEQNAGSYKVVWKGDNNSGTAVASGIYFLQMRAGKFVQTRKMMLLR